MSRSRRKANDEWGSGLNSGTKGRSDHISKHIIRTLESEGGWMACGRRGLVPAGRLGGDGLLGWVRGSR